MPAGRSIVTGADGHIGSCLVRRLLDRGGQVVAVDLEPGESSSDLGVEVRAGDVRDNAFLRALIRPGDRVFHLASIISTDGDPDGCVRSVNVEGAAAVAEACLERGAGRLVHFSSIHAFDIDDHDRPVTEQTPLASHNPRSAYARSKARGQQEVLARVARGLDAVVVNPCGVIGPYDYKPSRMGRVFRAIGRGRAESIGPGGFNWVDVRDVVEGALLADEKGRAGECYILAGHWVSSGELARVAGVAAGRPFRGRVVPMWMLVALHGIAPMLRRLGIAPPVTSEALDALRANPEVSCAKAEAELGYRRRALEETMRALYDWYDEAKILTRENP